MNGTKSQFSQEGVMSQKRLLKKLAMVQSVFTLLAVGVGTVVTTGPLGDQIFGAAVGFGISAINILFYAVLTNRQRT
jgi:hypothetical protein